MLTTAPAARFVSAERFVRILHSLVRQYAKGMWRVGIDYPSLVGYDTDLTVWVPREGTVVLQVSRGEGPALRTVTVCPGFDREFDVIAGNALVIAETHAEWAAFSAALDYLFAALDAPMQHEHDAFAV